MKKLVELVHENYDAIEAKAKELYREVMECDGRIQYTLYIWEDGELEELEAPQGSNTWLQPNSNESRKLYELIRVELPCFCWEDLYCDGGDVPESGTEQYDALRDEVLDYLEDQYDPMELIMINAQRHDEYEEELSM